MRGLNNLFQIGHAHRLRDYQKSKGQPNDKFARSAGLKTD